MTACWLAMVAGCASLPDVHLAERRQKLESPQFENSWGRLSDRESAAMVRALNDAAGNAGLLDRQIALEQAFVGAPLVAGNKVTLLEDGPATFAAMYAAMESAQHSINVESFIIGDGAVGSRFADVLIQRRAAGVQVNVIYDGFGAFRTSRKYFDRLRRAGIRVLEFNPLNPFDGRVPWAINHRDHRKQLIVDGRIAFIGGINVDSDYSAASTSPPAERRRGRRHRRGWRDTDVQIDGPVVADFQWMFLETWAKQHGPPLATAGMFPFVPPQGTDVVRAIGSTPDAAQNVMYLSFMAAIANAQKQIYITNAYFVPDAQLVGALQAAAGRGVDVRLLLPSTTDSVSAAYAAQSHYSELLKSGVKIYEFRGALLHAKTAVIDGVWSCVGSSNLDWRSAVDNDEVNAVVLGPDFGRKMLAAFARDQARSEHIDLVEWRRRPLHERMKEWFFRLCGRLL